MTRADDAAEIRRLIDDWSRAVEARDADGAVATYTEGTVMFDAIPPHVLVGREAVREVWDRSFPMFPKVFRVAHDDLTVTAGGDVAFVHGHVRFVPVDPPDHPCGSGSLRVTVGLRRIDGRWRVLHEHVSMPVDPESGQAIRYSATTREETVR